VVDPLIGVVSPLDILAALRATITVAGVFGWD